MSFKISLIDDRLSEILSSHSTQLLDAARYSLLSAGKRFRPQLLIASAITFGGTLSKALDPACAIEMVHAYSLIHDDLPCMDNDDLRRGKPTLHKAFSEPIALLTGNSLLTLAFEVLSEAPHLSSEQQINLVRVLAQAAGGNGMIGGQALDMRLKEGMQDERTLFQIHEGKTAALLGAALQMGAIIATGSIIPSLDTVGSQIGVAFQFHDDLLDATSTAEKMGKEVKKDATKGKLTAISLYGIEGTKQRLHEFVQSIKKSLATWPNGGILIKNLIEKSINDY